MFLKRNLILSILLLITMISFAQYHTNNDFEGPYTGLKYFIANDWLLNKQVDSQDMAISFGSGYGLILGYNFTESLALEVNININKFKQVYDGDTMYGGDFEYKSTTSLNIIEIPILFRTGSVVYAEIGPCLNFINKAHFKLY